MLDRDKLVREFESTLEDFWGETPTKRGICEAWKDYLDAVKDGGEEVPKEWYVLRRIDKRILYKHI